MHKLYSVLSLVLLILATFSCDDKDARKKYITINNNRYLLSEGIGQWLDDGGQFEYSRLAVSFKTAGLKEETFLTCVLYIPEADLQARDYYYAFKPGPGNCSHLSIGQQVVYDEYGQRIAGRIIRETEAEINGMITMERRKDAWNFQFDLYLQDGEGAYTITGAFTDELRESYVHY